MATDLKKVVQQISTKIEKLTDGIASLEQKKAELTKDLDNQIEESNRQIAVEKVKLKKVQRALDVQEQALAFINGEIDIELPKKRGRKNADAEKEEPVEETVEEEIPEETENSEPETTENAMAEPEDPEIPEPVEPEEEVVEEKHEEPSRPVWGGWGRN